MGMSRTETFTRQRRGKDTEVKPVNGEKQKDNKKDFLCAFVA